MWYMKPHVSNCVPKFVSGFWKAFCTSPEAMVSHSSSYHPQSNGKTESWKLTSIAWHPKTPCFWSQQLIWMEYAHNSFSVLNQTFPILVCCGLSTSPICSCRLVCLLWWFSWSVGAVGPGLGPTKFFSQACCCSALGTEEQEKELCFPKVGQQF